MKSINLRRTTVIGAVAALALGASVVAPSQAKADPAFGTYALVNLAGSDTIQDLGNGLATAVNARAGEQLLASWDAFGSTNIQTEANGPLFLRPNGSTNGLRALSASANPDAYSWHVNDVETTQDIPGQIDIARSSSGFDDQLTDGPLAYVPIARDAVTYATAASSEIPSGIPLGLETAAENGTPEAPATLSLKNIYNVKGYLEGQIGGRDYKFYAGAGSSADPSFPKLHIYVPQEGSGTRAFFSGVMGIDPEELPNGVSDRYAGGQQVQEHDGSALVNDPLAIAPFSIAQYIAQTNSAATQVVDRRHGAQLNAVDGLAPIVDGKLSADFLLDLQRDVYLVAVKDRLNNPQTREEQIVAKFLINKNTEGVTDNVPWVSSLPGVINQYGFGTETVGAQGTIVGFRNWTR